MSARGFVIGVASLLAVVAGAAAPSAARSTYRGGCAAQRGVDRRAAVVSLHPRAHAPRVFAMQYEQQAASVTSYSAFRRAVACLLARYVLPHLAHGRPNVVVFDEGMGLATAGIGSRGARARRFFDNPNANQCVQRGSACGAVGALDALDAAYARPLAVYEERFPVLAGQLDRGLLAATDTVVRGFMRTLATLATRYRVYMIASADLPDFRESRRAADIRRFADPDLHPRPRSVYIATSPRVHNEVFMWGPRDVRRSGPDVWRNVVARNLKVPLTGLELALGLVPGPSRGRAAVANLRPYRLPGTEARLGFATSLPAFTYGNPPHGVDPCSDTARYYMRCLNRLGANVVIQDDANPGAWTGPDGNGIEKWQPLSWMASTYRAVSDPTVRFDYNVTAMMVGNLADLAFDGQSAITQRGLRGRGCHYIGNGRFVPAEDEPVFRRYAGRKPDFLALAPWVVGDRSRAALRAVGAALAPGSHSRRRDGYVETALVADLPFPPDRRRAGCAR